MYAHHHCLAVVTSLGLDPPVPDRFGNWFCTFHIGTFAYQKYTGTHISSIFRDPETHRRPWPKKFCRSR